MSLVPVGGLIACSSSPETPADGICMSDRFALPMKWAWQFGWERRIELVIRERQQVETVPQVKKKKNNNPSYFSYQDQSVRKRQDRQSETDSS